MKARFGVFLVFGISVLLGFIHFSYANKMVAAAQNCSMQETVSININFNSMESSIDPVRGKMEEKIAAIEALAKEAGMTKVEMQSYNYSLNRNNNGGSYSCGDAAAVAPSASYQMYGNIAFNIAPADKATALMAALEKNGFIANLNVNVYRQCQ